MSFILGNGFTVNKEANKEKFIDWCCEHDCSYCSDYVFVLPENYYDSEHPYPWSDPLEDEYGLKRQSKEPISYYKKKTRWIGRFFQRDIRKKGKLFLNAYNERIDQGVVYQVPDSVELRDSSKLLGELRAHPGVKKAAPVCRFRYNTPLCVGRTLILHADTTLKALKKQLGGYSSIQAGNDSIRFEIRYPPSMGHGLREIAEELSKKSCVERVRVNCIKIPRKNPSYYEPSLLESFDPQAFKKRSSISLGLSGAYKFAEETAKGFGPSLSMDLALGDAHNTEGGHFSLNLGGSYLPIFLGEAPLWKGAAFLNGRFYPRGHFVKHGLRKIGTRPPWVQARGFFISAGAGGLFYHGKGPEYGISGGLGYRRLGLPRDLRREEKGDGNGGIPLELSVHYRFTPATDPVRSYVGLRAAWIFYGQNKYGPSR